MTHHTSDSSVKCARVPARHHAHRPDRGRRVVPWRWQSHQTPDDQSSGRTPGITPRVVPLWVLGRRVGGAHQSPESSSSQSSSAISGATIWPRRSSAPSAASG